MGFIGAQLGSIGGSALGGYTSDKLKLGYKKQISGIGGAIGSAVGGVLIPYKYGGIIQGEKGEKKGSPVIIEAHSGEFILPTKYVKELPHALKSKILKAKRKHCN
jgi:outer membrane lipoprotein SlyB